MNARGWRGAIVLAALTAVLAVLAGGAQAKSDVAAAEAGSSSYKIGIVYSRTGLLSAYGAEYIQGLRYGLAYATKGKMTVNGRKLELTLVDDATDPTKAVAAGRDLIGKGYKILAGSVSSGVALQMAPLAEQNKVLFISGPAATDAITGINRYTFRSGRQTYQDVKTAATFLRGVGRKVMVFAQDSAFGVGNYAAVNSIVGSQGHAVNRLLVPLSAQDFTPFAQQVKQANPDLLFVAWAGTTAPAMWRALEQQGAFGVSNKITTGLAERATWSTFGDTAAKIDFLSHYVSTAPKNKVNDFLVNSMRKRSQVPDLFTPDGFVAGQMIVRALEGAKGDNVDKMIAALEGWSFVGPKGQQTVRKSDHAMIQPMFQVKLQKLANGKWQPRVVSRIKGQFVAPPEPR
ncbi:MAG TPA: substrate-binding domain-containing protein [Gaiellaceae bacterium]|jgi:branched-chain amino acid transport system substrate-binding protein